MLFFNYVNTITQWKKILLNKMFSYFLECYAEVIGSQPNIAKEIETLKHKIGLEITSMRELMMLQGSVDLVLAASKSHVKPDLRCEEIRLKKELQKDKNALSSNSNSLLEKLLLADA